MLSLQLEVFIVLCQVFSVIEARSQELEKIRDSQLKATKKSRSTATTKRDAFENYIKMFYDLRKIEVSSVHYILCTWPYNLVHCQRCALSCVNNYTITTTGHCGLAVACLTAVHEVLGSSRTVGICVYRKNHYDLQPSAWAMCTLHAVPRSTQPSTLCGMVNEYQLSGWVIIINGDGGCRC